MLTENLALQTEHTPFEITDDGQAEWAIKKILEARSDTAKWQEHFAQQLAKIKAENDNTEAYMTSFLAAYFSTVPHKDTKTTSKYVLPSATLIRKKQELEYKQDTSALVAWLESNGMEDLIERKPVPKWGELKKRCVVQVDGSVVETESGEIVRGVVAGADLTGADLTGADLADANLTGANLTGANLTRADLTRANLDFASWPLWCGSLCAKIGRRIFCQLAYHLCRVVIDDQECIKARQSLIPLANEFHRVKSGECMAIECKKEAIP